MKKITAVLLAAALLIESPGIPSSVLAKEPGSGDTDVHSVSYSDIYGYYDEDGNYYEYESDDDYDDNDDDWYWPGYDDDDYDYDDTDDYFVSPVVINEDAATKLVTGYDPVKILYGSSGTIDISSDIDSDFYDIIPSLTKREIRSSDSSVLSISSIDGVYYYNALGHGKVTITVAYEINGGYGEYERDFECYITADMTKVKLKSDKFEYRYDASKYIYYYSGEYITASYDLVGVSAEDSPLSSDNTIISYKKKKGKNITVEDVYISDNKILVSVYGSGSAEVTITINDKAFDVTIKLIPVRLGKTTVMLQTGKSFKLPTKNLSGKVIWNSSNTKVATVNKKGMIKAKREGSSLVSAKVGDIKLYAVINVVTKNKMEAIKAGKKICKGQYSQKKRMEKGFYDCSSLVWRSLKAGNVTTFGSGNYAPTAADQAKYLVQKGRKVGKLTNKNLQKRLFRAGDLLFETGSDNSRYKGIFHVEMFTGYDIAYIDGKGKPVYTSMWLNRSNGYYWGGGFLARP